MRLPKPEHSIDIPSIHGDISINCRIYHPENIDTTGFQAQSCSRGAIVAHPYGPLGGSYDDLVVGIVTCELLRHGFVVANFNFRGSGTCAGRTSWTGKGEVADFLSVVGLLVHYLEFLQWSPALTVVTADGATQLCGQKPTELIIGGYSYGSLIATHLPSISQILAQFTDPSVGTAAHKILAQARSMAMRVLKETQHANFRDGADISRTFHCHYHSSSAALEREEIEETTWPEKRAIPVNVRYLLISPLLPPVSSLAAISLSFSSQRTAEIHERLSKNPTLAVFGTKDSFTSCKKLDRWSRQLAGTPNSEFSYRSVSGVGHFWHDANHVEDLTRAIASWLRNT